MTPKRPTILLVDDEPWFSESLAFSLESRGIDCIRVTDATSAMQELRKGTVTVLVTDVMMPAGSEFRDVDAAETGFHFIHRVRQLWPDLSVVCLSVIGDQKKVSALKRQGVRYLRKGETPLSTALEVISGLIVGKRYRY